MVHNSEILGALVDIVRGPESTLEDVEIAGRGISAEARFSRTLIADKWTVYDDPVPVLMERNLAFSDHLIERGEIGDSLAELWRRRCAGEIDAAAFTATLEDLVRRLEEQPEEAFAAAQNAPEKQRAADAAGEQRAAVAAGEQQAAVAAGKERAAVAAGKERAAYVEAQLAADAARERRAPEVAEG
ncbi:hypothetical protein JIG36_30530 [Actinoplanes sp. LDG1-06]|uniref:Uncharacterized protein n=1 Tax=Paractinoplanes ovalisporus TaxID=2810368 RepID=A0ABS2AJ71_9ACTN|nr:hypothetical protein [Actinoplanes ovalisporus]MBM2619856.1 hypothetical protein [Actinoplanes ovalisporus]